MPKTKNKMIIRLELAGRWDGPKFIIGKVEVARIEKACHEDSRAFYVWYGVPSVCKGFHNKKQAEEFVEAAFGVGEK